MKYSDLFQWQKLYPRYPEIDFGSVTERKGIIDKKINNDSEIRFNNYRVFNNLNQKKQSLNFKNQTHRNFEVFKKPLMDVYYDNAKQQYIEMYNNGQNMACLVNLNRENNPSIGRIYFQSKREDDIPKTKLDYNNIARAKDKCSPHKTLKPIKLAKMIGREKPGTHHSRVLKYNENFYAVNSDNNRLLLKNV